MLSFLAVGVGGSLGAVCRYLLGKAIAVQSTTPFPLATWIINLTGSFLLGLFIGLQPDLAIHPTWEAMIVLGFLSSYTTFSTFAYENLALVQNGRYKTAGSYIVSSLVLGILAAYLGLIITS